MIPKPSTEEQDRFVWKPEDVQPVPPPKPKPT